MDYRNYYSMVCTVRQANRKPQLVKPNSALSLDSGKRWVVPFKSNHDSDVNSKSNPKTNWVLCTENQLEEILMKHIEIVYNQTASKLVAMGYDEDTALNAILRNGHCYGGMDVPTNILNNSLACLTSGELDMQPVFSDLKKLKEYSLGGIVSLVRELRPFLSRGDAMWCVLMSNFHLGKAGTIQIPRSNEYPSSFPALDNTVIGDIGDIADCVLDKFYAKGVDFPENKMYSHGLAPAFRLQRNIEFPKKFNFSPAMKSLLKRNVAVLAAGFKANTKKELQSQDISKMNSSSVSETGMGGQNGDSHNLNDQDDLDSVLRKFIDLNIHENPDFVADEKDRVIVTLLRQVKDLEKQMNERKDWAYEKAIQAARKLSNEMIEVKKLRIQLDLNHRQLKGKEALDEATMKRLSEMENELRKASGQMDQTNAFVKTLEVESAEIRAELEASKLSASESDTKCKEIKKREKKFLKRVLAWEKQNCRLKNDISDEKHNILKTEEELVRLKQCREEVEVLRGEELKAKEKALKLIEEERGCKEAAEANRKGNRKALLLKVEMDFQRRKDDVLRLEQEISRLKASSRYVDLHHQSSTFPTSESKQRETIASLLQELDNFSEDEVNGNKECILCGKEEISIMFLPCAHQIMCVSCSKEYGTEGKAVCPCCRVPIQQRIRVFGTSL